MHRGNLTIVPYSTINLILDKMVSTDLDPYATLSKFAADHFYYQTRYSMLKKSTDDKYLLFVYTKPSRDSPTAQQQTIEVVVKNSAIILNDPINVEGMLLIKAESGKAPETFDFYKSVTLKKITRAEMPAHNPSDSQHFILLKLLNTRKSKNFYKDLKANIDQIKIQGDDKTPYSFHVFKISDVKNYKNRLQKKIKKENLFKKLQKGNSTVIFHGHCNEGLDFLEGENEGPKGIIKRPHFEIDSLIDIIGQFHFSKSSLSHIDFYSCAAGQFTASNPAFIEKFSKAFKAFYGEEFENVSLTASLKIAYFPKIDDLESKKQYMFCQSPSVTVQYGPLLLPLTSKASLKNTELYREIDAIPKFTEEDFKKSSRSSAFAAFKKFAGNALEESNTTLDFEDTHSKLRNMWQEFKKVDACIQKLKNNLSWEYYHYHFKDKFANALDQIYVNITQTPAAICLQLAEIEKIQEKFSEAIFAEHLKKMIITSEVICKVTNYNFKIGHCEYLIKTEKKLSQADLQLLGKILISFPNVSKKDWPKLFAKVNFDKIPKDLAPLAANAFDSCGNTMLGVVAETGEHIDALAHLISLGADINLLDKNHCSALHWAIANKLSHNNKDSLEAAAVVQYLLDHDAAMDIVCCYSMKPLEFAKKKGYRAAEKLLSAAIQLKEEAKETPNSNDAKPSKRPRVS